MDCFQDHFHFKFENNYRKFNCTKFTIEAGIVPESLLLERPLSFKFEKKYSELKLVNCPIDIGIEPES